MAHLQARAVTGAAHYIERYHVFPKQIDSSPAADLQIVVVIPVYNEPDLLPTLSSLNNARLPACGVEIILVVNAPENGAAEIIAGSTQSLAQIHEFKSTSKLSIHVIKQLNLPKRHAGVGWARKLGMDEATFRFSAVHQDGIIVCLDADTVVEPSYFLEVYDHFKQNPDSPGCSISFAHPLSGHEFESDIYEGIIRYELHLRYYRSAMKFCGVPYAFHTIGSAMAVRSGAYMKCGGMNRRKAGEDFYFLHKVIELGNFTELVSTTVSPSPRSSDRVPFGTGKAVSAWLKGDKSGYESYRFSHFEIIRQFIADIPKIYAREQPTPPNPFLTNFLKLEKFDLMIEEIRNNTSDYSSFVKRFFHWFNAFRFLKLVHFLRDHSGGNESLLKASAVLLGVRENAGSHYDILQIYRELDNNPSKSVTFWSGRTPTH